MEKLATIRGGCHCGDVQFEANVKMPLEVQSCNCSICDKTGFIHLIVKKENFNLLTPEENLSSYSFNTGVAKHLFCKRCGVKSFYVPRSNPNGFSINVRCIEGYPNLDMNLEEFDGQNWELHADKLSHLTE